MKKVLVIGLGKSGTAALQLLLKQGRELIAFDDAIKEYGSLTQQGVSVIRDGADIDFDQLDQIIVSPGIAQEHPLYQKGVARGIEVIGETELALRSLTQRAVAVTGTNGKTTVALLTQHILKEAGIQARAMGNIGEPLSSYVLKSDPDEVLVVELSSFQIETLIVRAFDAAVLLNITPDHLDRYFDMRAYAESKCALARCLKKNAPFFVQDQVVHAYADLLTEPYISFGASKEAELRVSEFFAEENFSLHDKENALAAFALCRPFNVPRALFFRALSTFRKPAHRIEFVCEINGICYYDDSKGTNVDAVVKAVDAMRGPVILIVGGVDKGASYLPWATHFKGKVKQIIALGQAAAKICEELKAFFEIERVDSLCMAVERARRLAAPGDNVLLSPGCSSYDMFRDYVHRGEEFQRYAKGGL